MRKITRIIFLTLMCATGWQLGLGQVPELKVYLKRADSIQTRYFVDTLGISLSQAQQYFILRDKFKLQSNEVASETSLQGNEQHHRFKLLRSAFTEELKLLFTPIVYQKYIAWVKLRMGRLNMLGIPLADDNEY